MSNDAFSSRSGGTDARPTSEYIRSNSLDRRSRASSATALMVLRGWSFVHSLLKVHQCQHRYLRIVSPAHGHHTSIPWWLYPTSPIPFFRSLLRVEVLGRSSGP